MTYCDLNDLATPVRRPKDISPKVRDFGQRGYVVLLPNHYHFIKSANLQICNSANQQFSNSPNQQINKSANQQIITSTPVRRPKDISPKVRDFGQRGYVAFQPNHYHFIK
ncbi:MAG: hypothetical protein IPN86_11055 [Saprospiraceae bacterium]|nr:hypothetical protein [Saprospiraceae bacterium]